MGRTRFSCEDDEKALSYILFHGREPPLIVAPHHLGSNTPGERERLACDVAKQDFRTGCRAAAEQSLSSRRNPVRMSANHSTEPFVLASGNGRIGARRAVPAVPGRPRGRQGSFTALRYACNGRGDAAAFGHRGPRGRTA